eukprot:107350-Chlamydomonas_euryale.AAC.9
MHVVSGACVRQHPRLGVLQGWAGLGNCCPALRRRPARVARCGPSVAPRKSIKAGVPQPAAQRMSLLHLPRRCTIPWRPGHP